MQPFGGASGGSKGQGSDMRQLWTLRNDISSEELAVYVAFAQVQWIMIELSETRRSIEEAQEKYGS
jgi:hypothetical protein